MTTAIILTLAALAQSAPPIVNESRPIAPEFIATLQKSEKTIDALKQFSVTAKVTSSLEGLNLRQGSTSTQSILVNRPGKVLVKADWAQFGETVERPQLRVLLDGNRLTTYFVPLRYVSVHEGKDAAEELAGEAIIDSTLEGSGLHVLTMPEMSQFVIAHTDEAKLIGSEAVDGIECQKFEVVYSGLKLTMWLGPVEKPLLRQLSETTVISQDEKSKLTSSRISKLSWVTDQQIPDQEFQLQLPENSRRVDNILQALSEVQKQSPVGKPAPEIVLINSQGKPVKPAEWKGRKVTLVFWASWMNDPETALKHASKLNADKKADESIYLINVGETAEKISELLKQVSGLPENLFDQDDDLAIELRLNGIPSIVEISDSGAIKTISPGLSSK